MNIPQETRLSPKDFILSVVGNMFIADYGYVNKVNEDGTVDVTHSAKPVLTDGTELGEMTTRKVEVLLPCGAEFSAEWRAKAGDRVLLVGLKDYVPAVGGVESAEVPKAFLHYTRSCLKAIPLCTSAEAKARVRAEDGVLSVGADKSVRLNGDDSGGVVVAPELVKQLGILTARVDAVINALKNSPTGAQDGGAAYKAAIVGALSAIAQKEDFGNIESKVTFHGTGGE